MKKIILTAAVCLGGYVSSQGQVSLTIEKAMDIAEEHSPSLRRSHMNLERYQQNLVAQRASLKSKFSLNLNPVDYSKSRSFDRLRAGELLHVREPAGGHSGPVQRSLDRAGHLT